jgi:hypothetical protein
MGTNPIERIHQSRREATPSLRIVWLLVAVVLQVGFGRAIAEGQPAPSASPPSGSLSSDPATQQPVEATPGEIAVWIRQLDDDRYAVREAAQNRLLGVPEASIDRIANEAETGSLESSTRALRLLLSWSESEDRQLALRAVQAIAGLTRRPAEAAMAANRIAALRQREAIAAIQELGGLVPTDQQLAAINVTGMPLQVIIGPEWKGGVDGLRHIRHIRDATTVSLRAAPLGDEALPELAELKQVRRIELYSRQFTEQAAQRLREQLPGTDVDRRSTAKLGISGNPIVQVVEGSAADKAGLQRGDTITAVGPDQVEDFPHLTKRIAQYDAGDEVEMTVLRQGKTLKLKVTFDRWGDDPLAEMTAQGRVINGQIQIIRPAVPNPPRIRVQVVPPAAQPAPQPPPQPLPVRPAPQR